MLNRKKKEKSMRTKLLSVVLLPLVVLGFLIVICGMLLQYHFYAQSIRDELASATSILLDCLDLTVRGDYSYEDGMLLKGDLNITDSTMLYRIKEQSQIDTTIFWQDTRILTTVENEYGVSAVGTVASPEVVETVLEQGENFYSDDVDVNGEPYIGYYIPIENSDHTVVGMVFAGKERRLIYHKIGEVLRWFVIFSVISIIIAVFLTSLYSGRMIKDINIINQFLCTISEGDLTATLDEGIAARNDELGSIGRYAARMRSDLQKMIEMDPLTSLYNRRSCNNKLKAMEKEKTEFSMVMCDIDFFKKINDNYGHDAGDYVLVTLSDLVRENMQEQGFASRWGGEEFLLVYELPIDETIEKVRMLQQAIREYKFQYESQDITITMTFGIESEAQTEPYEKRIKQADSKLYIGKNNGRDQIVA